MESSDRHLGIGLARKVAEGNIRVNVVRPGIIETEMHARNGRPDQAGLLALTFPMKRAGNAVEVAEAMVWLLGDDAAYCTGSILDLSGGRWVTHGPHLPAP